MDIFAYKSMYLADFEGRDQRFYHCKVDYSNGIIQVFPYINGFFLSSFQNIFIYFYFIYLMYLEADV